jgi:hypothetical protein
MRVRAALALLALVAAAMLQVHADDATVRPASRSTFPLVPHVMLFASGTVGKS